jgi:hypothetical protein
MMRTLEFLFAMLILIGLVMLLLTLFPAVQVSVAAVVCLGIGLIVLVVDAALHPKKE